MLCNGSWPSELWYIPVCVTLRVWCALFNSHLTQGTGYSCRAFWAWLDEGNTLSIGLTFQNALCHSFVQIMLGQWWSSGELESDLWVQKSRQRNAWYFRTCLVSIQCLTSWHLVEQRTIWWNMEWQCWLHTNNPFSAAWQRGNWEWLTKGVTKCKVYKHTQLQLLALITNKCKTPDNTTIYTKKSTCKLQFSLPLLLASLPQQ
jgi:hypothetical protein